MVTIRERAAGASAHDADLLLSFEFRQRSRLLTRLSTGEDVGLVLERGAVLRQGPAYEVCDWYLAHLIGESIETAPAPANGAADAAPAAAVLRADFKWLRHGDGNAEIVRSEMLDGTGAVVTMARLDDEVTFRFDVRCKVDLPGHGFGFFLRDRLGTDIVGVNTFQEGVAVPPLRSGQFVRYEFKLRLQLRPGAYGVSPAVAYSQEDLRFLDWINNALVIEVHDPRPRHQVFGLLHPAVQTRVQVLAAGAAARPQ